MNNSTTSNRKRKNSQKAKENDDQHLVRLLRKSSSRNSGLLMNSNGTKKNSNETNSQLYMNTSITKSSLEQTTDSQTSCSSSGGISSSKSVFFCVACNKTFFNYSYKGQFINQHVLQNPKCREAVFECRNCRKIFLTENAYHMHLNNSSSYCKRKLLQKQQKETFATSEVDISIPSQLHLTGMRSSSKSSELDSIIPSNDNGISRTLVFGNHFTSVSKSIPPSKDFVETNLFNKHNSVFQDWTQNDLEKDQVDSHTTTKKTDIIVDMVDKRSVSDKDGDNDSYLSQQSFNLVDSDEDKNHDVHISYSQAEHSCKNDIHSLSQSNDVEDLHEFDGNTNGSTNNALSESLLIGSKSSSSFSPHKSNVLLEILDNQMKEKPSPYFDKHYAESMKLIKILLKRNISLHAYNDFMKWRYGSDVRTHSLSLNAVMDSTIHKVFGKTLGTSLQPFVRILHLPSGRKASVVKFNFHALLFDLLSDPQLIQRQNLVFNSMDINNPFECCDSDFYGDFESSEYFRCTMRQYKINPKESVLCPIVFYLDELKLDSFGRMGLEPLVFTLLIFNRETRNKYCAWRTLGYLPNFEALFGNTSYTPDDKANDYHFCLKYLLEDFVCLQKNKNGILWDFKLDRNKVQHLYRRKIFCPLGYIIGDAKGNDLLCGRYGSRKSICVARDCDVLTNNCNNPDHVCKFHIMEELWKLNEEDLNNLSFRKLVCNAFTNVDFGHQPYGINGCTPPEPLHQFLLGIVERLPKSFFHRLSGNMVIILDRHVGYLCSRYATQSARNYPYMGTFAHGVSEAKKLSAKEKFARLYCIYLALLTSDFQSEVVGQKGRREKKKDGKGFETATIISSSEFSNWIKVFEQTILLHSWITLEHHRKSFFNGGRLSIVASRLNDFMRMYKQCAPRNQGMQLKLLKFHQLKHLWLVIRMYGSLLNVDSGIGESNNKVRKAAGNATQRRRLLLDLQTSIESFKRELFIKALYQMYPDTGLLVSDATSAANVIDVETEESKTQATGGSRFELSFDYNADQLKAKWLGFKLKNKEVQFSKTILDSVYEKLSYYNGGRQHRRIKSVCGFTEYTKTCEVETAVLQTKLFKKLVFRACPNYRGEKDWFDWAVVEWNLSNVSGDSEISFLESQLLMFIDFTTIEFEESTNEKTDVAHDIIDFQFGVFVHSISVEEGHTKFCRFQSSIATKYSMEKCYQMINVESIVGASFVLTDKVMDGYNERFPGTSSDIIVLSDRQSWSKHFLDYNDEALKSKAATICDPEISITSSRFPYEG